jgi:cytochrome c biogenesis protein CcdA/thiol-disulfide isomerase/thioredoxin
MCLLRYAGFVEIGPLPELPRSAADIHYGFLTPPVTVPGETAATQTHTAGPPDRRDLSDPARSALQRAPVREDGARKGSEISARQDRPMLVLIVFAFVAGAATAVSPCVLPVLPVALSAGVTGGHRRPLGVVTGLALSFTFATVALVYVISALGLPDSLLRTLAILALIGFGVCLLVPWLGDRLEARLSRLGPMGGIGSGAAVASVTGTDPATGTGAATATATGMDPATGTGAATTGTGAGADRGDARGREGFWSGMLVGGGLGFVYAPCAGPILAGVITVSASQTFTAGRLAVALAYGVGSAVVLYALMLGGRRLTGRLARRSGRFQMAMGAVMVLIALAMLGNYDTRFETSIATHLPAFLTDPTKNLETSHAATVQLAALRGRKARQAAGLREADAGLKLPYLGRAPEFKETQDWFNTGVGGHSNPPLTLAGLRGHVVLVDFWTYTCINCIRTLPYLNAWYAKYHSEGFDIVGVHTPEFPFEHSASNVAAAIEQNGIHYPVVQDNDYGTWNAYNNQYWPAEYLIDAQGNIRLEDFGEGEYATKERAIRSLLVEAGAASLSGPTHVHALAPSEAELTPESYIGTERGERFTNGPLTAGVHDYGALPAQPPPLSGLRLAGRLRVGAWGATAMSGEAAVQLRFRARRVYLVMGAPARPGSPGHPRPVRVLLDGRPIPQSLAGTSVHDGTAVVQFQDVYNLVNLPSVQTHTLTVEPAQGASIYDFTFG